MPMPSTAATPSSRGIRRGSALRGSTEVAWRAASSMAAVMKGVCSASSANSVALARRERSSWARSSSCAGTREPTGRRAPISTPSTGRAIAMAHQGVASAGAMPPVFTTVSTMPARPRPAMSIRDPALRARWSRTRRRTEARAREIGAGRAISKERRGSRREVSEGRGFPASPHSIRRKLLLFLGFAWS